MIEIDEEARQILKEIYKEFKNKNELSVSSPKYRQTVIDYFAEQKLVEKIDASTMSGWTYIVKPTYYGEQLIKRVKEQDNKNLKITNNPRVFISYCWEDDEHKQWVYSFADSLIEKNIDVKIDKYDLHLGDRITQYMEQSISESDYVLIICTPAYKEKSDNRKGGVGYENHIISDELLTKGNERKFIPVIRKGTVETAMPRCLAGKLGVDFSNEDYYTDSFKDLITTLHGGVVDEKINTINTESNKTNDENNKLFINETEEKDEPIKILGIITDQVTVPTMDGTRGSALYKIPFRLSKKPSSLWSEIFLNAWQMPPQFTSMHRPGIASVNGDQIILDGTTIEEVRKYHRDTLVLCVDIANKQEAKLLEEEKKRIEQEEEFKKNHYSKIKDEAENIKF